MLAECGGDHHKLMEQVDEHEMASGRKVIPAPPATPPGPKQATAVHIRSPRLANPEQARRFEMEVTDEGSDA
jgi:hypothetical protein